uniref:Parathyroid hormone n=1 Tax=Anser cygnoides TaxID=8845 RepID=A0A8B9IG79_ANSCY
MHLILQHFTTFYAVQIYNNYIFRFISYTTLSTFLVMFLNMVQQIMQGCSSKRAVTEHQLMHDKGRAFQGLKRLMWLHNALGSVHTASSRDISLSDAMWDSQKSQDTSDLYDSIGRDEASSLMKQLLELIANEQGFPLLKKMDLLQYLKTPKELPQRITFSGQKNNFLMRPALPEGETDST